ncbi:MAG: hypothetical protein AVDCRST_MAG23-911, partial [uncultured Sphingosinicella sp.]
AVQGALARARYHSPFLRLELDKRPEVAAALDRGSVNQAIEIAAKCGAGASDEGSALRRQRGGLALAVGMGDL